MDSLVPGPSMDVRRKSAPIASPEATPSEHSSSGGGDQRRGSSSGAGPSGSGWFHSPRRLSVPRLSLPVPSKSQLLDSLAAQRKKLIRRCTAAALQAGEIESTECNFEGDNGEERFNQIEDMISGEPNQKSNETSGESDASSSSKKQGSPRSGSPSNRGRRMSVAWISAILNPRFVRSFSERLAYSSYKKHYHNSGKPKAECWWRRLRARKLNEAETNQALEWLRQAGFPQYAQQFEENAFPLETASVRRDHEALGQDEMDSLLRRIEYLNTCATNVRSSARERPHHSSDEDLALSNNWEYHRKSHRWSRIENSQDRSLELPRVLPLITRQNVDGGDASFENRSGHEAYSSHDSVFLDSEVNILSPNSRSPDAESQFSSGALVGNCGLSVSDERLQSQQSHESSGSSTLTANHQQPKLRRSGSERIKDAIARKVDSFRRRKRENRSRSPKSSKDVAGTSSSSHQSSPKAVKDKRECYENPALQDDSEAAESVNQLNAIINPDLAEGGSQAQGETRRDSGVGGSIPRTSMESIKGTAGLLASKWHCYPSNAEHYHPPTPAFNDKEPVYLSKLTASQHMLLRKHALLRLTAIMEKHSPPYKTNWTWSVPKFIKKITTPNYKDKILFGVPLSINIQRTGQPLPPCIQFAMQYLVSKAPSCYGIFRKSGVKSRIDILRSIHEQHVLNPSMDMYENHVLFDVADMIKQYFREIPEGGLLTSKLSPTFRYIFMHIPDELRFEATQSLIAIMPDENREALEVLLCFLDELSQCANSHGMNASNLATCFSPSIFQWQQTTSPKRSRKENNWAGDQELNENKAGNECLFKMVEWHKDLFCVSVHALQSIKFTQQDPIDVRNFLPDNGQPLHKVHFELCLNWLVYEVRFNKGYTQVAHPEVDLAYKKIDDEYHYIRLWKATITIPAPAKAVLHRLLNERFKWDFSLIRQTHLYNLDNTSEIYSRAQAEVGQSARRQYLVFRSWKVDITRRGTCAIVEVSVSDPNRRDNIDPDPEHCHSSTPYVRAHILASRYLIQPIGTEQCKVLHFVRVEPRGRNGYWHSRSAGYIHALHLSNLAQSFKNEGKRLPATVQPPIGSFSGTLDDSKETQL